MKEQQKQKKKQIQDEASKELLSYEEDEQMRLAVEASLLYEINNGSKKATSSSNNDSRNETASTKEKEDLDLAIKLSMDDNLKVPSTASKTTKSVEEEATLALKDDPIYANYFLMKNEMNVDVASIKEAMKIDGIDESILDLDPNKSLKEQQQHAEQKIDNDNDAASYEIALQLQREENQYYAMVQEQQKLKQKQQCVKNDGVNSSVRTVSRDEFERQKEAQKEGQTYDYATRIIADDDEYLEDHDYCNDDEELMHHDSGFRLNSNTISPNKSNNLSSSWNRSKTSRHSIVGPNGEMRTKHDVDLKHLSNAQRLLANEDNDLDSKYNTSRVSDNAYNSFHQKLKRHTNKGVAMHAHGKSESYGDKTRGGAMDASTRLILSKAINNNIIKKVNGVVSEGKEAIVYHADDDVAIKVFKRIQEFRNRGDYVDGDVRYYKKSFAKADKRQQLEIWAEKARNIET